MLKAGRASLRSAHEIDASGVGLNVVGERAVIVSEEEAYSLDQ